MFHKKKAACRAVRNKLVLLDDLVTDIPLSRVENGPVRIVYLPDRTIDTLFNTCSSYHIWISYLWCDRA